MALKIHTLEFSFIQFECDYGYGYIEVIDRRDERNTTYEIIVEDTYDNATEDQVIDYIKYKSGLI